MFFLLFGRRKIPARVFENCVFSYLKKRLTGKENVRRELEAVENIQSMAGSEEQREKLAARWYFILERYISEEQPKYRLSKEALRERILRYCRADRAEGGLALIFLNSSLRQIRIFELFSDEILNKVGKSANDDIYSKLDGQLKSFIKAGRFDWPAIEKKIKHLPLAEQRVYVRDFLKKSLTLLAKAVAEKIGELRAEEFIFKEVYTAFRERFDYLEDAAQALLIIPDDLLKEERIGLMQKTELEDELKRRSRELESTLNELKMERTKMESLTREELEEKIQERTADLLKALEDLKLSRVRLEDAKSKDDAFLEGINEGLAAIDRDWKIILWNKAAAGLSEFSKEEALDKPFRDIAKFIKESDRSENILFIEEAFLFGKMGKAEKGFLAAKSGKEIAVEASVAPIFNQAGKAESVVIIFRDVSKERELEQAKEEFASLATHQLRTPLASIKGFVSLLIEKEAGGLNGQQSHYVSEILKADNGMIKLVNAMLNVSRIELGTLAVNPEPAYLPEICDNVLEGLAPVIAAKKINILKTYDKALPSISVDISLAHAIFQNLISNAVKYNIEGGRIKIAVEKSGSEAVIKVEDTGCGIPKSQQSKIFSKLFRADNAVQKEAEGTGLGLYIVKSILEQAGGRIWFESEENKGSVFYAAIPLSGMKKKEGAKGLA